MINCQKKSIHLSDTTVRMTTTLLYSNPLNYIQKLQNFITKFVIVIGYILGFFPYKWCSYRQQYFLRSKTHQVLSVISIVSTIISSFSSLYTYKNYIFGTFIKSKIDVILNLLSVSQFFVSVILACLTSLLNRIKVLKSFNKIIFLKKNVLKLNKNPHLDTKYFKLFMYRWVVGALIVASISFFTDEAAAIVMDGHSCGILSLVVFSVQYTWYTASVTALLCCSLFASHLVRVITIDLKEILQRLRRLKRWNKIKPGQFMFELCELSDRIDYLGFCHFEIIQFVQMLTSLAEISLLGIACNIFTSIITDTANIYLGLFRKDSAENEQSHVELMTSFAYLWFAFNELYFMNVGPQELLNRMLKLQRVVGTASTLIKKGNDHVDKSVSVERK